MTSSRKKFLQSMAIGTGTALSYPLVFAGRAEANTTSAEESGQEFIAVLNVKDFGAGGEGETDDTGAIQAALTAARDQKIEMIYVPAGIYHISEILIIYENTTLHLAKNAVIVRKSDINAMLINGTEFVSGYDGESNITVEGGTWDGNSREFPSNVTPLGFGHARNITIQNLIVLDVYNWHHVEINAIDGATIQDCRFEGMVLTRAFTEMVQIDLMGTEGMFPWFGEFDNTTCRNVLINRCIFQNGDTAGIGTHSTRPDARHEYITITNCEFINLTREGIVAQNWQNVTIENNFFRKCNQGILMEVLSDTDCTDVLIADNKMLDIDLSPESFGIQIHPGEPGSRISHIQVRGNYLSGIGKHGIIIDDCSHAVIQNNTVKGCAQHGIWSRDSGNISVAGNTAFDNAQGAVPAQDIRINDPEAQEVTTHHMISANNAETCRVDAAEECLISGNIFKSELTTEAGSNGIKAVNNFINGEYVA